MRGYAGLAKKRCTYWRFSIW